MSDDWDILDHGPAAIVAAARAHAPLNWSVLAQACARRAYAAAAACAAPNAPVRVPEAPAAAAGQDVFGWAEATIISYEMAAAKIPDAFARQGRQLFAHGWRAFCILNGDPDTGKTRRYLAECGAWAKAGLAAFAAPEHFRRLLHEDPRSDAHLEAILLRERLETVRELWRAGLFSPSFDSWFRAAGIKRPTQDE
ncbi:hypothetical protein [Nannocystis punicea]|uniref:Uncharacterized protein n=1 Tax=Nannocystis punicea TaxID=2995304 RepID=A0ABY7HD87_9BACT|nr:hypothetical protein [Nannocystis poenicansa]WAS97260.1 hypothetical protein O0S08_14020 [Nannocystis poenicansa]